MREDMLGNAKELGQYVSQQLADAVRAEVIEGVAAGESMTEIRDRISELDEYQVEVRPAGGAAFKRQRDFRDVAETIARTESRRIYTEVGKAGMREAGIEKVRWLAASDPDPICAPLAGQVYDINDVPFGGPPAHHNCRCALQPVVE
jgi:SPP1 gp7 family putative phage head morphogenesis protein